MGTVTHADGHVCGNYHPHDLTKCGLYKAVLPLLFKFKEKTISKTKADYVDHPVDGERCDGCSMFRTPDKCTLVEGVIAENGHCRYWEAK